MPGAENLRLEQRRIHKIMEDLNLPRGQYVIAGSAVMVLHGIERHKPMGDLDLFVATRLWFEVQAAGEWDRKHSNWQVFTTSPVDPCRRCDPPYLYRVMYGLEVNVFHGWRTRGVGDIDVNLWVCNQELADGLPCVPLEMLLNWKTSVGRTKDHQDIIAIRKHLGVPEVMEA